MANFLRAKNGARTRDPQLGKLMLYRLSYFRMVLGKCRNIFESVASAGAFFLIRKNELPPLSVAAPVQLKFLPQSNEGVAKYSRTTCVNSTPCEVYLYALIVLSKLLNKESVIINKTKLTIKRVNLLIFAFLYNIIKIIIIRINLSHCTSENNQ